VSLLEADGRHDAIPAFWYDIPYGYLKLDMHPTNERMEGLARQILELPEELRDRADQVFRLYAIVMWEMQKRRVQGCALGLHPNGQGGASTSVLTVSSVGMPGVNPKAVLAGLIASGAGDTRDEGVVPVQLPCGPAFVTASVMGAVAPGRGLQDTDTPSEEPVWQGTVAIPDARSSSVIAVQLVTSSIELADDYRKVLLGVAGTVTFTDPESSEAARQSPDPGSGAEAMRNDFG
jgi:hypothetical protein